MTLNNDNSIIKIIDSSGNPLDTTPEGLKQLELMDHRLNKDNCKLDMKNVIDDVGMDDIALMIKRSNAGINIIAHILVNRPGSGRDRIRYYFLYNNKNIGKYNLLDVLKDFIDKIKEKIREENEKYIKNNKGLDSEKYVKIDDNKDSAFIFEDLNKVVSSNSIHKPIDDNIFDAISKYFNKGRPLQFKTDSIEKAVRFLIDLDSKIIDTKKYVYYILYLPTKTRRAINPDAVNISIAQDRYINDIEFTEELKTFIRDYERDKIENEIKNKVDSIQKEIEPGITNSHVAWKSQKINLSSEIRKRLAENLYKTIDKFTEDIKSEMRLYGMSDSFRDQDTQFMSNVNIGVLRWFKNLILLFLVISIGFISGMYVESNGIDIPYVHNIIAPVPTDVPMTTDVPITNVSDNTTLTYTDNKTPTDTQKTIPIVIQYSTTPKATPNSTVSTAASSSTKNQK